MDDHLNEIDDGLSESFGDFLKRHREASGKSLDEVSRNTRISKRFLEAFETNDSQRFPEEAFTRGFIRAYSIEVGVDAEESMARYERLKRSLMPTQIKDVKKSPKFVLLGEEAAKLQSNRYFWGIITAVFVILGIVAASVYIYQSQPSAEMAAEGSEEEILGEESVMEEPVDESEELAPSGKSEVSKTEPAVERREAAPDVKPSLLRVEAIRPVKVQIQLDEAPVKEWELQAGESKTFEVFREVELKSSDKTALNFQYNGKPLEVVGPVIKLFNRNLLLKRP